MEGKSGSVLNYKGPLQLSFKKSVPPVENSKDGFAVGHAVWCVACMEYYTSLTSFQAHMEKSHSEELSSETKSFSSSMPQPTSEDGGLSTETPAPSISNPQRTSSGTAHGCTKSSLIQYFCSSCTEKFSSRVDLETHKLSHLLNKHSGSNVKLNKTVEDSKYSITRTYNCHICNMSFNSTITWNSHLLGHCEVNSVNLKVDFGNPNKTNAVNMPTNTSSPKIVMMHKCEKCNKSFDVLMTWKRHMLKHSEMKSYTCSICGKTLTTLTGIRHHLLLHTDEKSYKCELCEKSFTHKTSFTRHKLLHRGEKPYTCDECDKSFTHRVSLNRHFMLCHTAEWNNQVLRCEICDKTFSQAGFLTRHMESHAVKPPRKCNFCDKSYQRNSSLKKHMYKYHIKQKPFKCTVCEESYITANSLAKHMERTHVG